MDTMGQRSGTFHGVVLMRCSEHIVSWQSPLSVVSLPPHDRYHHHLTHQTASVVVNTGLVGLRQKLQCRGGSLLTTSGRSSRSFDSPYPLSCSSFGLWNFWIPGSTHSPFGPKRKMSQDRLHLRTAGADEDIRDNEKPIGTRKVVEHVVLFKMKDSVTEEQEKEMLDSLWSLQYQIKNVLCTSVGRLVQITPEGFTHALFSRFPNKQALDEYMESPTRWRVAQDLVIPFYHGKLVLDFEGEVEDNIETIFRRGDDFQEGVEHVLFFRFKDNVSSDAVDKFLKTANSLPAKFGELVQLTAGANVGSQSKGIYTHGLVARLPSEGAYGEYEKCLQADPSWVEGMELFETSKTITANFVVSPIGKTF